MNPIISSIKDVSNSVSRNKKLRMRTTIWRRARRVSRKEQRTRPKYAFQWFCRLCADATKGKRGWGGTPLRHHLKAAHGDELTQYARAGTYDNA